MEREARPRRLPSRVPNAAVAQMLTWRLLALGTLWAVSAPAVAQVPPVERDALIAVYKGTGGSGWVNRANWRNAGDTEFNAVGTECTWAGVTCGPEGRVVRLSLRINHLNGTIPTALGNLTRLGALDAEMHQGGLYLDFNVLTGGIPPTIGNLTQLVDLVLDSNQLSGSIPPALGGLTNLQWLTLSSNQLSGSIPTALSSVPNLYALNLASNHLTGGIPPELGNRTTLGELSLGSNRLAGNIPTAIGNLTTLRILRLHSNRFIGSPPTSLTNLTTLPSGGLDLRWNALHTSDASLRAFLNSKQNGGDWESTQTIPVTGLVAGVATQTSLQLSWTPILYTADAGGYRVEGSTASGGPYTLLTTTASKASSSATVDGLGAGTTYYFVVTSVTNPHANNQNTVVSEASAEATAPTIPWSGPSRRLSVTTAGASVGTVTSSPPGVNCGGLCSATFIEGEVVTLTATPGPGAVFGGWSGDCAAAVPTCQVTMEVARSVTARFAPGYNTVTPCRLLDSRDALLGGPAPLAAGSQTPLSVGGNCGIPETAAAVSLNVTVTEPTTAGHLTLFAHGSPLPLTSAVNYPAGTTRANNVITALGASGQLDLLVAQASGTAHVTLDVNGYFQ
jgi:hypothetical protein